MKKVRRKSWLINALSFALALCITVSSLLCTGIGEDTMVVEATTSAKSRVQTFIGLAAGKSGNSLPDIGQLTQDELQFLGVYLSNFYVPFSTELGISGQTDTLEEQKKSMVDALMANMNFNETVCNDLVENIMGLSRSNCKELKVRFRDSLNFVKSSYGVLDVSYYDFINMMLGDIGNTDVGKYDGKTIFNSSWGIYTPTNKFYRVFHDESVYYAEFGYEDGSEFKPMFDACIKPSVKVGQSDVNGDGVINNNDVEFRYNFTASQIAFYQCLCFTDSSKYGFDFFDISTEDLGVSSDADSMYDKLASMVSDGSLDFNKLYNMSAYSNKVGVDCFGNIIRLGSNHQSIIVPGCMNPYTWMPVFSDGTSNDSLYGKFIQSICIPSMSLNSSNLLYEGNLTNQVGGDWLKGDFFFDDYIYNAVSGSRGGSSGVGQVLNIKDFGSRAFLMCTLEQSYYKKYGKYRWFDYETTIISSLLPLTKTMKDLYGEPGGNGYSITELYVMFSAINNPAYNYLFGTDDLLSIKSWNLFRGLPDTYFTESFTEGIYGGGDSSTIMQKVLDEKANSESTNVYSAGAWLSWGIKSDIEDWILTGFLNWNDCGNIIGGCGLPYYASSAYGDVGENYVYDNICLIDELGAFGFDSSNSDIAYDSIQFVSYFGSDGSTPLDFTSSYNSQFSFGNEISSCLRGEIVPKVEIETLPQNYIVSLYTTYAVAGLYIEGTESDNVAKLGYRLCRENLPTISNSPLLFSDSYADELVDKELRNMLYYLLKPDAVEYVKVALKNKLQAILVDWHNDMVGTSGTGYTTGTTYYRTNYGYVTTPDLSEMQWTASLINLYNNLIPMLVIFMVVSMLIAFITGTMSLQRAVLGTLVFSAFLLIPTNAINFVVEKSNSITNNIYGEKFIYWAVVQEETYGTALDSAATGDSYENYIKTLYSNNAANQGGESIVVKWQAPKKMASLMLSSKDKSLLSSLQGNLLSGRFLNNSLSGEAYLDGESQYLYRDYSDLANMSRYIYNSIVNTGKRKIVGTNVSDPEYSSYVDAGYTNGSNRTLDNTVLKSMYTPIYDNVTSDTILQNVKAGNIDQGTYLGINQDLFNVSVAYFNNQYETGESGSSQELYFDTAILNNATAGNETGVECLDDWFGRYPIEHNSTHRGEDLWNSLMVYGILSESPFYYYSWNMYDDVMDTGANASGGYRAMLLSDRDGGYFYNMGGNGELKDFMNMRCLFKYVIPYLKKGNDIVRAWDERYGIFVYDGIPTDEGYLYDNTIQSDDTLRYKYWHNLNVARLYEIYTPWVDLMYDCSYAEPCYVKVMGEKIWIEDPLDPWSYPDERPMIFSESEMYDYGLTEADLTEVERNILKFNREAQEDMYELLNYYNFSDLSLNTAAAMECTFIFNQVFSESGLFSSNINLYPQSFEIKDFSYDAFLRFILSTTTGESMSSTQDFYGDVVKKSSTTTAILLIVCDVLSQYVMPFAKIVFLLAIFISSILLIMVTVFKVDPEFKFVGKLGRDIFLPLIEFFAITVIFAYVISLFMGTGNNAVTQSADLSISLGDPNMVLVAMCIVNLVCIVLYVKLLMGIWSNIKTNASLIKSHVTGLVGGVVAIGAAGARAVTSGIKGSSSSGGSYNEGTGKESARATARSSKRKDDVIEKADMGRTESERMAETKRTTMKTTESKSNEKRSDEINGTIKSGKSKVNSGSGDEKGTK